MNRLVIILLPLFFTLSCLSTGNKSYDDVTMVLKRFISSCETYLQALEDNDTPEGIANAINNFVDAQNAIRPELKRVMRRYPELSNEKKIPHHLKELTEKMQNIMISIRMQKAEEKLREFKDKPPVMEALVRLQSLR